MLKKEDKFGLRSEICTLSGALYVVSASETQLIQGVCASTQLKLAPGLYYTIIKNYSYLQTQKDSKKIQKDSKRRSR